MTVRKNLLFYDNNAFLKICNIFNWVQIYLVLLLLDWILCFSKLNWNFFLSFSVSCIIYASTQYL